MTALAAGLGAAIAGGPDEASAQATEILLPHPEREIVVDVSRVAFERQAEILEQLGACLEEGKEFADANGDGEIKGAGEAGDFEWAQADCAESAERQFSIADSEAKVVEARARIDAMGDAIIEDLQGGS